MKSRRSSLFTMTEEELKKYRNKKQSKITFTPKIKSEYDRLIK